MVSTGKARKTEVQKEAGVANRLASFIAFIFQVRKDCLW